MQRLYYDVGTDKKTPKVLETFGVLGEKNG
jgi:hypothetical protein